MGLDRGDGRRVRGVYELIKALPETNVDVVEDLLDVVDHFRALDPACGSGHFLTSVQSEF